MRSGAVGWLAVSLLGVLVVAAADAQGRRTVKPPLHGRHWMPITGKPLAATAGALSICSMRKFVSVWGLLSSTTTRPVGPSSTCARTA